MHDSPVDVPGLLLDFAEILRTAADKAERLAVTLADDKWRVVDDSCQSSLTIDRETLAVRWNGRSCYLGFTMAFRLLERLARRPNFYVTHDQLLQDIWGGPRSKSAIRSAVNDLRSRLASAGMGDLANAIDGSNAGRYGLILRGLL